MSKVLHIWVGNRVCMMAQDGTAYKLVRCMSVYCIQDMQQACSHSIIGKERSPLAFDKVLALQLRPQQKR